ncbi:MULTISPECIES: NADH:ubiquinone oxidoreductase [unclassified Pseudomonas]|uniref:NADH:ubiquinone oxidoreductase n=1 Tax=unclassified Pseudomonas TaxID=196821 RepID=UPI002AC9EBF6|nr:MULTISPECIES: NADH:ubiquinone oxidoreductase [unclassified Pseudomonas]MEB0047110.1 NADH:ubiquinone oxidoreductase [Pseudomonas sp. Dout3]MEB0098509.1 NADH:ubiquinone oxidoreductase [Pseudomonas sp. DC1.2]WPX58895.1 NADH:ubiquinone oxidoreductase [Pseudomonas sp. DC1.2]
MRWMGLSLLLTLMSGEALAQACVVHSQAERLDVKVCQQNRTIPQKLFADGFCQPNLPGQKIDVQYVDQCPDGAIGVCSNAQVANMPYRQDIHYYGVATDAAYLKPYCEAQSRGSWLNP